jgi:TATA-box binding protein (TBP) (component of TFIID and TFIIIB)
MKSKTNVTKPSSRRTGGKNGPKGKGLKKAQGRRKKNIPLASLPLQKGVKRSTSGIGGDNVLKYIEIMDIPGTRLVGTIVNVAAHFHLGLAGIDVEAVAAYGLATFNRCKFGAGTVRILMDLPAEQYSGNYDQDVEMLIQKSGIRSTREYDRRVEFSKKNPRIPVPAIKYPLQNITALLFDSAQVVLTGAPDEYTARYGAALIARMLCKYMKIPARIADFRACNIVITFSLGFQVDLERFAREEGGSVDYEPSLFPAVIIKSPNHVDILTMLINFTGIIILTGSSCRRALRSFFTQSYHIISKYKKGNRDPSPIPVNAPLVLPSAICNDGGNRDYTNSIQYAGRYPHDGHDPDNMTKVVVPWSLHEGDGPSVGNTLALAADDNDEYGPDRMLEDLMKIKDGLRQTMARNLNEPYSIAEKLKSASGHNDMQVVENRSNGSNYRKVCSRLFDIINTLDSSNVQPVTPNLAVDNFTPPMFPALLNKKLYQSSRQTKQTLDRIGGMRDNMLSTAMGISG